MLLLSPGDPTGNTFLVFGDSGRHLLDSSIFNSGDKLHKRKLQIKVDLQMTPAVTEADLYLNSQVILKISHK